MSSAETVKDISIKQLASKCHQEHAEIKDNILAFKKIIESGLEHLSRKDLVLVGANVQFLSKLLSDLDSYIAAIQVVLDRRQPLSRLSTDGTSSLETGQNSEDGLTDSVSMKIN